MPHHRLTLQLHADTRRQQVKRSKSSSKVLEVCKTFPDSGGESSIGRLALDSLARQDYSVATLFPPYFDSRLSAVRDQNS